MIFYVPFAGANAPPDPGGGLTEFTIFYGERIGSTDPPSDEPLDERNLMVSYLPRSSEEAPPATETWEAKTLDTGLDTTSSYHPSSYPVSGSLNAGWTADTAGGTNIDDGTKISYYDSPFGGRFNTTPDGAVYLEAALPLIIQPEDPIDHWGAYFTDIGDFGSQLVIEITDTDDVVYPFTVDHSTTSSNTLHFWGFIDPTGKRYKRIYIKPTGTPFGDEVLFNDFFGIDDVILGIAFDV